MKFGKLTTPFGITTLVWAITNVVYSIWSAYSYHHYIGPTDVYAQTYSFQFIVWLFLLPFWLAILGVALLAVHFAILIWRRIKRGNPN